MDPPAATLASRAASFAWRAELLTTGRPLLALDVSVFAVLVFVLITFILVVYNCVM
jgi:hypothetical protein